MSTLRGSDISQKDIDHAHEALELHVKSVLSLYGEDQMTYNVHSLLNLTKSVENLGPLWAQSVFMLERSFTAKHTQRQSKATTLLLY